MRVKMTFAVLAIATLALVPAGVVEPRSRTVHVEPGESIQAAIDEAKPGTTIKLEEGTYEESVHDRQETASSSWARAARRRRSKCRPQRTCRSGAGCVDAGPAGRRPCRRHLRLSDVRTTRGTLREPPSRAGRADRQSVDDVEISNLSVDGFDWHRSDLLLCRRPRGMRELTQRAHRVRLRRVRHRGLRLEWDVKITRNVTNTWTGRPGGGHLRRRLAARGRRRCGRTSSYGQRRSGSSSATPRTGSC